MDGWKQHVKQHLIVYIFLQSGGLSSVAIPSYLPLSPPASRLFLLLKDADPSSGAAQVSPLSSQSNTTRHCPERYFILTAWFMALNLLVCLYVFSGSCLCNTLKANECVCEPAAGEQRDLELCAHAVDWAALLRTVAAFGCCNLITLIPLRVLCLCRAPPANGQMLLNTHKQTHTC